jgi:hypothetical protein
MERRDEAPRSGSRRAPGGSVQEGAGRWSVTTPSVRSARFLAVLVLGSPSGAGLSTTFGTIERRRHVESRQRVVSLQTLWKSKTLEEQDKN